MKILLLTACLASMIQAGMHEEKFLSKEQGFSIAIPEGYTVKANYSEQVPVMILSKPEGKNDDFTENINVVTQPFEGDVETYYQVNLMGMQNVMRDFKLLKNDTRNINGLDTHWMLYTFTYADKTMEVLAYCFTFNGKGYVVTCSSTPESFNKFEKVFKLTGESFSKE